MFGPRMSLEHCSNKQHNVEGWLEVSRMHRKRSKVGSEWQKNIEPNKTAQKRTRYRYPIHGYRYPKTKFPASTLVSIPFITVSIPQSHRQHFVQVFNQPKRRAINHPTKVNYDSSHVISSLSFPIKTPQPHHKRSPQEDTRIQSRFDSYSTNEDLKED